MEFLEKVRIATDYKGKGGISISLVFLKKALNKAELVHFEEIWMFFSPCFSGELPLCIAKLSQNLAGDFLSEAFFLFLLKPLLEEAFGRYSLFACSKLFASFLKSQPHNWERPSLLS